MCPTGITKSIQQFWAEKKHKETGPRWLMEDVQRFHDLALRVSQASSQVKSKPWLNAGNFSCQDNLWPPIWMELPCAVVHCRSLTHLPTRYLPVISTNHFHSCCCCSFCLLGFFCTFASLYFCLNIARCLPAWLLTRQLTLLHAWLSFVIEFVFFCASCACFCCFNLILSAAML